MAAFELMKLNHLTTSSAQSGVNFSSSWIVLVAKLFRVSP